MQRDPIKESFDHWYNQVEQNVAPWLQTSTHKQQQPCNRDQMTAEELLSEIKDEAEFSPIIPKDQAISDADVKAAKRIHQASQEIDQVLCESYHEMHKQFEKFLALTCELYGDDANGIINVWCDVLRDYGLMKTQFSHIMLATCKVWSQLIDQRAHQPSDKPCRFVPFIRS